MRTDSLQQFVKLRALLAEEKESLETRLRLLNEALGAYSQPATAPLAISETPKAEPRKLAGRGRPSQNEKSLRERVIEALSSGPRTKEEVLALVQKAGYRFSTKNPANSLGVILYGKKPKFNRAGGKFSLSSAPASVSNETGVQHGPSPRKRRMSAAGRKAIAQTAKRRWAEARAAGKRRL